MNKTPSEAKDLIRDLVRITNPSDSIEIGIAPPFVSLSLAKDLLEGTSIKLVAQNCSDQPKGAFTGEVSAAMLKDLGCDYVLVGHSERRQLFGETNELISKKVQAVLEHGMKVIIAIGETLEQRESGKTLEIVLTQLDAALSGVSREAMLNVVIAYEPVWAIGTGKTATPEQAQEVHAALRQRLVENYDADVAAAMRFQYGGSVKPGNAKELFSQADIDGGLIGGASLKAEDFAEICKAGS